MFRVLLSVVCLFSIAACNTQRMVCPAYQSSFIYDKEATRQRFSYFKEDSTPKIYTASKNKYLVAVPESYKKRLRKLQTVEMTPVYPVPDSLEMKEDFSLAEMDSSEIAAGASIDTTYAITKTKEKYNLDQDLYMWYFREILVLPDVRAAMDRKTNAGKEPAAAKEKKGIKGFFQNLFRKKKKVSDSTATAAPVTDVNAPPPAEKKRGGLFKRKKAPDPAPAKKEGDGF